MKAINPAFENKRLFVIAAILLFACTFFVQINKVNAQCAIPSIYNVTGGGAYCQGGLGVPVGLDNSEEGVSYQLMEGANEAGDPVEGTGTAISFGNQTIAGAYTVVAFNSGEGCSSNMEGSATVTINQSPIVTLAASGPTVFCNGGAVTLSAPDAGNALQFDGVDDYVNIPNPVAAVFTIEAWIKTSAPSPSGENAYEGNGIIWSDVGGDANDFTIAILNNRLSFFDGADDIGTNGSIILNDGVWHHIAVVRNGANNSTSLFVDGIPDGSNFAENVALNDNPNIAIGANTLDERYFEGSIDEVRIWNVARTQAEIQASMHTTIPATNPGLLAYYTLDETIGTTALDATGNGNTGTLENAVTRVLSTASLRGDLASYLWSNGDTTPSINAATSGNYQVSLTDSNGCQATSDTTIVTVNPLPATPTITPNGPVSFCKGDSVILTSSGARHYQWYKNGIVTTGTKQSKTIVASGVFAVVTTNTAGCRSAQSEGVVVTVNPMLAKPVITVTFGTFCSGGKATLTTKKATSYQWYKDEIPISGATNKTYNTKIEGTYTVTVANETGCRQTSDAVILSCSSAAMANAKNPGQLTADILPNPAINDFTLLLQSGDNKIPVVIRVTDMYGKPVYETTGTISQQYKFGESFSAGTYILQILQGSKEKTMKIVKLK